MSVPRSKDISKAYSAIEAVLGRTQSGLSRKELMGALGWVDTGANDIKLKRYLETLRLDPTSKVVAWKNGQKYGFGTDLPKGTHEITWHIEENPSAVKADVQAITLVTAIKFAKFFLPPKQRTWLEEYYEERSRVDFRLKDHKRWQDKIRVEPRYPPIYPDLGNDYENKETIVFDALQCRGSFLARYDFEDDSRIFFPVRLLRRELVLYVLCANDKKPESFKEYAIHRLSAVKPSKDKLSSSYTSRTFIDQHIAQRVQGDNWGIYDTLKIRISGPAKNHFTGMRFNEDKRSKNGRTYVEPEFSPDDTDNKEFDAVILTIKKANYTYEMKTWLLGLGASAQVLEPKKIRKEIEWEIKQMALQYSANTT